MRAILLFVSLVLLATSAEAQSTKVIICKGPASERYHSHICQGLKNCSTATEKVTLTEAKSIGRTPCGYCYKSTSTTLGSGNSSTTNQSSQCAATTKKGSRCSRNSRSGGYCWQHGG